MIVGIGTDLVDMRRIERLLKRFGTHFTHKIFTAAERAYAEAHRHPAQVYANRFAAKEAAAKALGTGIRHGITWQDIEVTKAPSGEPSLLFHGKARAYFIKRTPEGAQGQAHVSVSDEPPYSTAFVVLSAIPLREKK